MKKVPGRKLYVMAANDMGDECAIQNEMAMQDCDRIPEDHAI